jgi:saccharopine dehydrogenase (NADP+, L-glutamate forming)
MRRNDKGPKNNHSMKQIGILGAGRSAGYLVEYLGEYCARVGRELYVYDLDFHRLQHSFTVNEKTHLVVADLSDTQVVSDILKNLDVVVSVLPPPMHLPVANLCLEQGCHLFTASYTSEGMLALDAQAKEKGLLFMNELGLDPGIDHLSASKLFDHAKSLGLEVVTFESHCGGLVDEACCENNPWKYKFTWNPTNVVLAGQGGSSIWKEEGEVMQLNGHLIFANAREITVPGIGVFDVYANRNSLTYEKLYGLTKARTLLRGTLRRRYFCAAWDVLVVQGFTDSKNVLFDSGEADSKEWFSKVTGSLNTDLWIESLLSSGVDLVNIEGHLRFLQLELGCENLVIVGKTSAQILEQILLDRWALEANHRDEVVMVHKLGVVDSLGDEKHWYSVLKVMGEGGDRTAMAKTVGLPLAMGVETFLEEEHADRGVCLPFDKSWYAPILEKLERQGIVFDEHLI